jgi:hypothetical protein
MTTSSRHHSPVSHARSARLVAAAALALSLSAAPAFAVEDAPAEAAEQAETGSHGEEEGSGKIQLAEGPRDRVGLIVLAFFAAVTIGGAMTASRQLRGKRPQASGEFRWR